MNERAARAIVGKRSGGACEVRLAGICTGRAAEWHHRKNRSQGGGWTPSNGLHLCPECHRYITEHPARAREMGWAVASHDDPATTPAEVWMWGHMQTAALLDDVGDYHLHRSE